MARLYNGPSRIHRTGSRRLSPLAGLELHSIQGPWAHDWWGLSLGTGGSAPWRRQIQEGGRRRCGIPPEQPRSRDQSKDVEKPNCKPPSVRLNDMQMPLFPALLPCWVRRRRSSPVLASTLACCWPDFCCCWCSQSELEVIQNHQVRPGYGAKGTKTLQQKDTVSG